MKPTCLFDYQTGGEVASNDARPTNNISFVESAYSPQACVGSLQLRWLPSTVQRRPCFEINWGF